MPHCSAGPLVLGWSAVHPAASSIAPVLGPPSLLVSRRHRYRQCWVASLAATTVSQPARGTVNHRSRHQSRYQRTGQRRPILGRSLQHRESTPSSRQLSQQKGPLHQQRRLLEVRVSLSKVCKGASKIQRTISRNKWCFLGVIQVFLSTSDRVHADPEA